MVDAKVISRKRNPLLKREEAECILNFESGTPKSDEIKQAVAKALTANPDLIYINKFNVKAGAKQGEVEAFVYETKEMMDKLHKKKEKKEKKK
ncbi:MAG: hypothetical protein NZ903_01575 [Candidatus Micrarchaeota archaeon]|nr:hypothetical protein [Candidatus Micrarchaeota archaeon]